MFTFATSTDTFLPVIRLPYLATHSVVRSTLPTVLPVAMELNDHVLGLPLYWNLEGSTIQYVCAVLDAAITETEDENE